MQRRFAVAGPGRSPCLRRAGLRSGLGWLLGALILGTALVAWADTHALRLSEFAYPGFTVEVRVEGQDVRFIDAGDTGDEMTLIQTLLYTLTKQAEISVFANFAGDLPDGIEPVGLRLELHEQTGVTWTQEGGVATTLFDISTNRTHLNWVILVQGRAVLTTTDPNWTPTAGFTGMLHLARPITVTAGGGGGGMLPIYAYSVVPYFRTNQLGLRWVEERLEPLPDASVKAESIGDVHCESGWLTTDGIGRAMAAVWAPASSVPDAAGLVNGQVRLKAVKDRATVEREVDIRLPYARVAGARGATLVARPGTIFEPSPIVDGENLFPGDVVQVGNEVIWSGAYLTIQFCNGQQVTLQADTASGLRAVVGQGSLDQRVPVLQVTLENFIQDLRTDPRRYGRLLIYKALGNTVDNLLGLPDPVGWTVTTPGGALENWLADFVEPAYGPTTRARALWKEGGAELTGASGPPPADAPWVAGGVDFFTDGTARLYNRGGTVRLRAPSASVGVPRSGMCVARLDVPGGSLSPVGLSPVSGFDPMLRLVPADGATEVSSRPAFELTVIEFGGNTVLPGGLTARADGVLLRTPPREENRFRFTLPPGMALSPGPHRWEVELVLNGGGILRTGVTFEVTSVLPAPPSVQAVAGTQGVALRWAAEALDWARGGFRVYRTAPGGTRALVSGPEPLREPSFLDMAPVAGAVYEVTGLDASGREGQAAGDVRPAFPGRVPAVPSSLRVTPLVLDDGAGLALVIEDTTAGFTLWRVEAGPTAEGPFTDVLGGQLTSRTPWPIPNPWDETRRWFRVTALNADGVAGPPAVVGPVDLPWPVPPILGVTVSPNPDGSARLCWNPWTARALLGYRIELWRNDAWQTVAEVGSDVTAWTDATPARGELRQWRVRARLVGGGESPPSAPVALRPWTLPTDPGQVRFATAAVAGLEGETVTLPVVREGGLDLPAFVTWSTWGCCATATPEADFVPGGGLLVFAPGETQKVVSVQLLTDAVLEPTDEVLYVQLLGVEGGPRLGEPAKVQVLIGEGGKLEWEPAWLYAREGEVGEVRFNVILTRPSAGEVRVDFQFEPERSTATPELDFTGPLSGTLVFGPGQTNQSFAITVLDDALKEGISAESVVFRLLRPQGAALDDQDPFRVFATLQIDDDDTRPGYAVFAEPVLRLREGQSRTLSLRREGGADGSLEVFLFPASGTAKEDEDWTLSPRFPRFEEGQTELTVTFRALSDGRVEGPELVVLNLHGFGGPAQTSSLLVVLSDADSTGSGFLAWAEQTLADQPPAARAPTADTDGDGRPNWVEFLWLTDPTRADQPALPASSLNEWGEWQLRVTVREDAGAVVWAEFADDVLWNRPTVDAGTWQSNGDGTHTGTFRYYSFGARSGFMRLRAEWLASP